MTDLVIAGTRRKIKEMADGTLRIEIDIEPNDKAIFHRLFPDIDMPVALAPLNPTALAKNYTVTQENDRPYGQQARELKLSPFFLTPAIWRAIGEDSEFLDWLKLKQCALAHGRPEDRATPGIPCSGDTVPAHVRRVANGAGTGIKPEYSAIPLCHAHHSQQHHSGETSIAPRAWWDRERIEYVASWAWESLKDQLGYSSWSEINPAMLHAWAVAHSVDDYLPRSYREASNG